MRKSHFQFAGLFLMLVLSLGAGQRATAAVVAFNNRALFEAALNGFSKETFESSPIVGTGGSGAVLNLVFADFSVSSVPAALKVLNAPVDGAHNTTPAGTNYLNADTDLGGVGSTVNFTFTFATPVTAFGTDITDAETGLSVLLSSGDAFAFPGVGDGGTGFFGVISDAPITGIQFSSPNDSNYGFDDVTLSSDVIPEPATALLGLMASAGFMARRRRTA